MGQLAWFVGLFIFPQTLLAAEILVRPSQSGRSSDVIAFSDIATSQSKPGTAFQVRMTVSCFGTNLRMVENPLSPFAAVRFDMELMNGTRFGVVFPGWLTMNDRVTVMDDPSSQIGTFLNGAPGGFTVRAKKNTIVYDLPDSAPSGAIFDAAGNLTNLEMYSKGVSKISFTQDQSPQHGIIPVMNEFDRKEKTKPWAIEKVFASIMRPLKWLPFSLEKSIAGGGCCAPTDGGDGGDGAGDGGGGDGGSTPVTDYVTLDNLSTDVGWGQPKPWLIPSMPAGVPDTESQKFMGRDGILAGHWEYSWSSDFKTLNVNATFPGQVGFCGGYFSPLMLFFDQTIPKFNYSAKFKMSSVTEYTAWPEPEAKAAFLVLDRNQDGIINDVTEMFGSEDESTNGFEILKVFDENEDGVIDAKDSVFSELKLWADSTGTGKTLKKDLRSLKQAGVQSISLGYDSSRFMAAGPQAELRQRASFVFVKNGKKTQGNIIDVWFKGSN